MDEEVEFVDWVFFTDSTTSDRIFTV